MTWLAIYGAGLSTALALAKLIPEWPVAFVAPAETPGADRKRTVSVRVINPAKRPLFLVASTQFPRRKPELHITEQRPLDEEGGAVNAFQHNLTTPGVIPHLYVPAEGAALLTVKLPPGMPMCASADRRCPKPRWTGPSENWPPARACDK